MPGAIPFATYKPSLQGGPIFGKDPLQPYIFNTPTLPADIREAVITGSALEAPLVLYHTPT